MRVADYQTIAFSLIRASKKRVCDFNLYPGCHNAERTVFSVTRGDDFTLNGGPFKLS